MLIVDRQHNVGHSVSDLVICGQVKRRHAYRPDHILDFWVVPDHPEVLDLVVTSCSRVFADTLKKEVTQFRLDCALE